MDIFVDYPAKGRPEDSVSAILLFGLIRQLFDGFCQNMNRNVDNQYPCVIPVFVNISPSVVFLSRTISITSCIRMCMMCNLHGVRIHGSPHTWGGQVEQKVALRCQTLFLLGIHLCVPCCSSPCIYHPSHSFCCSSVLLPLSPLLLCRKEVLFKQG